MKLSQLLKSCPVQEVHGNMDLDVPGLHYDSRQIRKGDAFCALRGVVSDGHGFIRAHR